VNFTKSLLSEPKTNPVHEFAARIRDSYLTAVESFCRGLGIDESNASRVTLVESADPTETTSLHDSVHPVRVVEVMIDLPDMPAGTDFAEFRRLNPWHKVGEIRSGFRNKAGGGFEFFVDCKPFMSTIQNI